MRRGGVGGGVVPLGRAGSFASGRLMSGGGAVAPSVGREAMLKVEVDRRRGGGGRAARRRGPQDGRMRLEAERGELGYGFEISKRRKVPRKDRHKRFV